MKKTFLCACALLAAAVAAKSTEFAAFYFDSQRPTMESFSGPGLYLM